MSKCIDNLTFGEIKELMALFGGGSAAPTDNPLKRFESKRCLIRTYSAGVHIGDVKSISDDGMSCVLENALRLWKWEGGGLSLSAVANNGIKKGRLNKTGGVGLTNCIEFIETTEAAEKSFEKFIED